jgi:hypothetical protein
MSPETKIKRYSLPWERYRDAGDDAGLDRGGFPAPHALAVTWWAAIFAAAEPV